MGSVELITVEPASENCLYTPRFGHTLLAPRYVNPLLFAPFAVRRFSPSSSSLRDGCGPALFWGVGNGPKNGLVGGL